MHHFIYPTQDTFITNVATLENLNFGLNEVLRIGSENISVKTVNPTTTYSISQSVVNLCVINFSGSVINASLFGTASYATGIISSSNSDNVTASYYTGTLTGSYASASSVTSSNFTGSLIAFSGSFRGIINGTVSGSLWSDFLEYFNGGLSGFTGKFINGIIVGNEVLNQQNTTISAHSFLNRALVQFDLTAISKSIVNKDIINPNFTLKLKVARAENLPIKYSLYAFPISESWVMGNGCFFDNGSSQGASWIYRDASGGIPWITTGSTYINSPSASQLFNYEVGDVSMDVTSIANAWISQSIPNNGLVLLSSDELNPTSSGITLFFFSQDTNTIYVPTLDVGWNDLSIITGSVTTGSVIITTIPPGLSASISDTPTIKDSSINGNIFGIMNILFNQSGSGSGTINLMGTSGNVNGVPIFGHVSGSKQLLQYTTSITLPGLELIPGVFSPGPQNVQEFFFNFGFFPFVTTTTTFITPVTASLFLATMLDGQFSGCIITASIDHNVQLQGNISGSWNTSQLFGTMSANYPFLNYPDLIVSIQGPYFDGMGYGTLTSFNFVSISGSGIFSGTIIDGPNIGAHVILPFTGSLITSSFSFTSSVLFNSSSLDPMEVNIPFTTVIRIPEKVKNNQILRVNVFGRQRFPLKNFQRLQQFSQFLTPEYLPTSSFYAIKDNETEEIILNFDANTQISCDLNGSYFMLDTSGLPQERYFKVLIKIEQSGSVYILDNEDIFKVVR